MWANHIITKRGAYAHGCFFEPMCLFPRYTMAFGDTEEARFEDEMWNNGLTVFFGGPENQNFLVM